MNIQTPSHAGHSGLMAHFHRNTGGEDTQEINALATQPRPRSSASAQQGAAEVRWRFTAQGARFVYKQPLHKAAALPDSQRRGQSTGISAGEHVGLICPDTTVAPGKMRVPSTY